MDKWFADRTISFAKFCGYSGDNTSLSSAIGYLEKQFKIPYDQSVGGGIFRDLINLTPSNHHFKSLGHNPTLLGLFFSILNQFTNTSDFVSNGELISLNNSDGKFELHGDNIPSKIFCGIANWIGHFLSMSAGFVECVEIIFISFLLKMLLNSLSIYTNYSACQLKNIHFSIFYFSGIDS